MTDDDNKRWVMRAEMQRQRALTVPESTEVQARQQRAACVRGALSGAPPTALELFCLDATAALEDALPHAWADVFVEFRLRLQREFLKGRILSTTHGVDVFTNVLGCLAGAPWKEEGDYGNSFRNLIREFSPA